MKVKNFNIRPKALTLITLAILTPVSLTGCTSLDNRYTYDKALIFSDHQVTVVDIEKWVDYGGDRFQIKTISGLEYMTNTIETKLIDSRESSLSLPDFIHQVYGEDIEIHYLEESKSK